MFLEKIDIVNAKENGNSLFFSTSRCLAQNTSSPELFPKKTSAVLI
jgi:hypothetical protein